MYMSFYIENDRRVRPRPTMFIKGEEGYLYVSLREETETINKFINSFNPSQIELDFKRVDNAFISALPFAINVEDEETEARTGDVFIVNKNTLLFCLLDGVVKGAKLSRTFYDEEKILAVSGEAHACLEWDE